MDNNPQRPQPQQQRTSYNNYHRQRTYHGNYADYNASNYGRPPRPTLGQKMLRGLGNIIRAFFNIPVRLWFVVPFLIVSLFLMYFFTNRAAIKKIGGQSEYDEAAHYIEIKDVAEENFIDGVDRTAMGDSAARAMISGLNDKWSYYMTADEYRSYQLSNSNEYAELGFTMVSDNEGGFQVLTVTPLSPAATAGLTAGMVIESVDGESVLKSDYETVRNLIRSKLNTVFTLGIRNGDDIEVDCTVTYSSPINYRLEKTNAGYVQIYDFEAGSGQDSINAIEDLLFQGAESLVIDVRNNPGGLASEVATLLDYLLPKCDLFSLVGSNGKETVYSSDSICVQMPIVVLVNTGTYAEAEVFAQVIKDNTWATLMGETTSGSTRIQKTIALSDGSAVRLSTSTYITASGVDIAAKGGVVPDYIIYNSDESTAGTTEGTTGTSDGTSTASDDEQLMQALKFLS